ncbi:hypothetical protein [Micromonospora carbonacea]|uniref:Helix-turn-helix domain-containing protein n=1 Tax=Micromonospora carbonacea TaxID=47853 RepID=A0A1C5ADN2_9ACTN|nr:hypothetical protein [Micromonospora carbonacea]SCF43196.1 hypothetical protein GA0070563_112202 [Micromonospora carbonacea]
MTDIGRPYTLPEVAAMTGLSLRSIERGCRNGSIEHTPIGDGTEKQHRRMYPHQVQKLVESRTKGATRVAKPVPALPSQDDDIAAAIAASRKLHTRRTGLRAA